MMKTNETLDILVAEDDFLVCRSIKLILQKLGHNVIGVAVNGEEACSMAVELTPDVILMDIHMPVLNGLEAAKRVHKEIHIPVVILTAHESMDLLKEATECGVGAYLTKPPEPMEIERALTIARARHCDMMELKRLNAELKKAMEEIQVLRGIIPICCSCKKIRIVEGEWQDIESYIQERSEAQFSHSLCNDCAKKLYPETF